MKKEYRIKEIPESVPPMWTLEEYVKRMGHANRGGWRVICLSEDLDILEGMKSDFIGQAIDEHNGIRK